MMASYKRGTDALSDLDDKSLDMEMDYNPEVEPFREAEYPMLKGK